MKNIVILTGAGISAESGVATFRGVDGLWEGHRIEDVASPEGFARNPALVQRFYNLRRAALKTVQPNPAHQAIARLQHDWGHGKVTLITQNVDDLHERGGSRDLWHMHGELLKVHCTACRQVVEWSGDVTADTACRFCERQGTMRPDIVWFGEMPFFMDEIYQSLQQADLFVAIGTSGHVYPAAGFVAEAARHGASTLEFNVEPSQVSAAFKEQRIGPAGQTVPAWVDSLLNT